MMPIRSPIRFHALLLAGSLAFANPAHLGATGPGSDGKPSGSMQADQARERLQRVEDNAAQIQSKFPLQEVAEAGPLLQNLQSLLAQAHEALASGNYSSVLSLCAQIDTHISTLHNLGSRRLMDQGTAEQSGEQQRERAQWDLQRTSGRFEVLALRMQESKSPNAAVLMEKVRALLTAARQELAAGRPQSVRPLLLQVESLFPQMARLTEPTSDLDKHGFSGSFQDSYGNQRPAARTALAEATEIYNRVHERVSRLLDQRAPGNDPKSAELLLKVQEALDKCGEALASGRAEAAKEFGLKAEALLTEWHQGHARSGEQGLPGAEAALYRLSIKLDRAMEIVKASSNEKALRILDKAREHFQKAETGQAEGQASRVQVEMDIALKLAAKAVDISRSGQTR